MKYCKVNRSSQTCGKQNQGIGNYSFNELAKEDIVDSGIRKELQDPLKLGLHRAETSKRSGCGGVVFSGKAGALK